MHTKKNTCNHLHAVISTFFGTIKYAFLIILQSFLYYATKLNSVEQNEKIVLVVYSTEYDLCIFEENGWCVWV